MQTTSQDAAFLAQRRLLTNIWRSIGPVLVAAVAIFYGTVWYAAPMLVDPFAVMDRLQADSVDLATLQTMAIMLPLVTTLLCLVLLGFIAHVYRAVRIERRYQQALAAAQSTSVV